MSEHTDSHELGTMERESPESEQDRRSPAPRSLVAKVLPVLPAVVVATMPGFVPALVTAAILNAILDE